jgi:hypothetical protein
MMTAKATIEKREYELHKARAYIQPYQETGLSDYVFWTQCETCPQWPWPPPDEREEAYYVYTCHDSRWPAEPCEWFAYMEGDADDGVWVYCRSPKWQGGNDV